MYVCMHLTYTHRAMQCCLGAASGALLSCLLHTALLFKIRAFQHKMDDFLDYTLSFLSSLIATLILIEMQFYSEEANVTLALAIDFFSFRLFGFV